VSDTQFGFDWSHSRFDDPDTSKRAAALASIRAGSHKRRILDALEYHHPVPLTFELIAVATGLRESAVWKRLSDLQRDSLVRVVDSAGLTRQGSPCQRYAVVE
jgi:hypothetical protein